MRLETAIGGEKVAALSGEHGFWLAESDGSCGGKNAAVRTGFPVSGSVSSGLQLLIALPNGESRIALLCAIFRMTVWPGAT